MTVAHKALAIIKVIVTAAPTYLAIIVATAPLVADYLAEILPAPWSERATAIVLTFAAVAAATLELIRRVTPVARAQRGLLPPGGDA